MAGPRLGRTAYDWDEPLVHLRRRRAEHVPDLERTPPVALDVYEHAYLIDFETDRASYIEASSRISTGASSTTGSSSTR